jgi:hypothetical protein
MHQSPQDFPRRPPPRNTNERKYRANKAVAGLLWGLSQFTEAWDMAEALYDSLPEELHEPYAKPLRRLEILLDNFDKIDPFEAAVNLITEAKEDALYGNMSRVRRKALNDFGFGANPYRPSAETWGLKGL